MSRLTITTETFDQGLILQLSGSAGIATADQMQAAVTRAIASRPSVVIVDLSGLLDLSSLFAGQLISLHNGLKHRQGRALLAGGTTLIRGALDRMRIGALMPVFDDVEAARGSVTSLSNPGQAD